MADLLDARDALDASIHRIELAFLACNSLPSVHKNAFAVVINDVLGCLNEVKETLREIDDGPDPAATPPEQVRPTLSLLDVIRAYKLTMDAFNRGETSDDTIWRALQDRLQDWEGPADSAEGAIEGLKLIDKDIDDYGGELLSKSMAAAAIGFLETLVERQSDARAAAG